MMFAHFTCGDIHVLPGDILKINVTYIAGKSEPEYQVYHVEKACCVLGLSEQGPVIKTRQGGDRLATSKELAIDGTEVQPRPKPTPGHISNGFC